MNQRKLMTLSFVLLAQWYFTFNDRKMFEYYTEIIFIEVSLYSMSKIKMSITHSKLDMNCSQRNLKTKKTYQKMIGYDLFLYKDIGDKK